MWAVNGEQTATHASLLKELALARRTLNRA
jgi:hypothetical protein